MRTRIVILLVVLTLLAVAVSGLVSYALQRTAVQNRIDASLASSVEEVRILASEGVDPETGKPFVESDNLVFTAMTRHWPDNHESMIGLNSTGITYRANDIVPLRLEDDAQLVEQLLEYVQPETFQQDVLIQTFSTSQATYRAALIPIYFADDAEPSLLVFATNYSDALAELDAIYLTYAITGVGVIAIVALLGSVMIGRQLSPLRKLQATAAEISDEDLDRRVPVTSEDDIADLSRTFNEMLDRIQCAFRSQRQLLDDVGHELRTPITIVQGNLELMNAQDASDVEQVREISLDELDRVARLVEDLMTLAKADRPDFVTLAPTDIDALTRDVLEKASHLGERKWSVAETAQIVHDLDSQRITQAWLQLANNAVKYSDAGAEVIFGSRVRQSTVEGPLLELWIHDGGIGISEDDIDRIFERFGRGGNSTRAEGSGLGLNIVTEIVRAHGGKVSVQSTLGFGSTFTMSFPLRDA
ncbi:sensor histidine kinase [Gulosibacter chungangensis]|uniref:histidine kinase n=1 Tax=Gulosibacter chungangensis TaxID=979746 RepID=A0A7J5BAG2_9MICO|nr:HAMP domain-containing sensor histidine kinase [Gulosibacter chungangensis]KAB1642229.1 HAMP domain-containing histidine kinase [Gulosibacter chungangensis]